MPVPIAISAWTQGSTSLAQGPDLSRYLTVCTGLLVLVLALAWGFRRLVAGRLSARAAQRSLRILDVLPLGHRRQLSVVRCYDRTFVLGLGEKEVTLVAELDPVVGVETKSQPISLPDATDFSRLLDATRKRLGGLAVTKPGARRQESLKKLSEVIG